MGPHRLRRCSRSLLRFMTWWQAAAARRRSRWSSTGALLPRVGGRRLYRPVDDARGFPLGILLYPLAVLLLILDVPVAARHRRGGVGDPGVRRRRGDAGRTMSRSSDRQVESLRGRSRGTARRRVAGTVAFIVFGGDRRRRAGVVDASAVVPPPPLIVFTICRADCRGDRRRASSRRFRCGSTTTSRCRPPRRAVLWFASLMTPSRCGARGRRSSRRCRWRSPSTSRSRALGYLAKNVSVSGAIGGAVVGTIIYAGRRRRRLGVPVHHVRRRIRHLAARAEAQDRCSASPRSAADAAARATRSPTAASRRSRRSPRVTTPYHVAALLAFVAALTAGGSDTVASEIGKAWGTIDVSRDDASAASSRHARARCRSRGRRPASSPRLRWRRSASRSA